jgi:DNA repair ATPase RecN
VLSKNDLKEIGKLLEPVNEKLDTHTVSLINLEKEIKAYMDALDVERKRIDKHDDRLEVIEESLDLNP